MRPLNKPTTELVCLTTAEEETVRLEEEEREDHLRLCEALFSENRRLVRADDIPFHGWSSPDIVTTLLQDVKNQVGRKCRLLNLDIIL